MYNPAQFKFNAIGTSWTIDITTPLTPAVEANSLNKIKKRIGIFDKTYSRFLKTSLITKISLKEGKYLFPSDARALFLHYKKFYEATSKAFTPIIGQVLSDAGYDTLYSLVPGTLTKPPAWNTVIDYKFPYLTTKKPVLLDFGAAGKGYLIDIIAKLIKRNGISDFYINAGGDIFQSNLENKPIKVGLEHPTDKSKVIGIATITNKSICASSGNRRNWGKFHHIINPLTLTSPKGILSTWAVANTAILADGLATSLFFTPGKKLKSEFDFEYLVVFSNLTYEISSNFPGVMYTNIETLSK